MSIFKFFQKNKQEQEQEQELPRQQEPVSGQTCQQEDIEAAPAASQPIQPADAIQRSCANAVGNAEAILNMTLDYTDESMAVLQKLIEHYRPLLQASPNSPTRGNIIMMLGCYLGETLRRNHLPEAHWDETAPLPVLVCGELKFGPLKEVEAVLNGAAHHVAACYGEMRDIATGKIVAPPFSRGGWKDRKYENTFLNLSFTMPENWIAASEEKLAQAMPDSYVMWCCGGPDLMHAVLIMAAPMEKLGLPIGSTALNYLAKLRMQLGSSNVPYAFSQPFQIQIGGEYYSVLPCLRENKDLQLYAARTLHGHISVALFSMPEKDKNLFPVLVKQFAPLVGEKQ